MIGLQENALWSAAEVVAATGGACPGDWLASGVSIDSRTVRSGDLFVALDGPNFDAHDFIADAINRGAVAALSARPVAGVAGHQLVVSEDTLAALTALGIAARARCEARIIGVTGSVGKTGVKDALALVLGRQAPTAASQGSLNNRFGVPLSLARMARSSAYGVFEIGMNHPGEIAELAALVRPDAAIVTTVEIAHLAHFDSLDEIAAAKAEIFAAVAPGGTAIINRDNPQFGRLRAAAEAAGIARIIAFGAGEDADCRVLDADSGPEGSTVTASLDGATIKYRVGIPGRHWVINSLAIIAAAAAVGADAKAAAAALAGLAAGAGRGARHTIRFAGICFELIDESYNASPAAMEAAFAVLGQARPGPSGRRIAVLGDMLELGAGGPEFHIALAAALDEHGIDQVFTAGPLMRGLYETLPTVMQAAAADSAGELAPMVATHVGTGDVVLVKGSLGSDMGLIVRALTEMDTPQPRVVNGS